MTVERIYWDSDPFLAWLQEEAVKIDLCNGTIDRAEKGDALLVTSALTMAEVLWRKGGPKLPQAKLVLLRKYFRRSYIRVINVSRSIAEGAQEVVYNFDIKPKDAVHVATALQLGIGVLETFDDKLIKKSGKCGGSPTLVIRKPQAAAQGRLKFNK